MAVKGYTNAELEEHKEKKLVLITWTIAALHLLLILGNIVFALVKLWSLAFLSMVIYIVLLVIYIRGTDLLSDRGYEKLKLFKLVKIASIICYAVSFIMAVFSGGAF